MSAYILRRVFLLFPTLFLISIVAFMLVRLIPGDATILMVMGGEEAVNDPAMAEPIRRKLGLDKPYHIQYGVWLSGLVRGDWGRSLWTNEPVLNEILGRFPVTFEIAIGTMAVSLILAIPMRGRSPPSARTPLGTTWVG